MSRSWILADILDQLWLMACSVPIRPAAYYPQEYAGAETVSAVSAATVRARRTRIGWTHRGCRFVLACRPCRHRASLCIVQEMVWFQTIFQIPFGEVIVVDSYNHSYLIWQQDSQSSVSFLGAWACHLNLGSEQYCCP